jgi:intracellular septation protein A
LGAGLLFFAVLVVTNDIYKATAAGIILGLGQAGWTWINTRKIEPMQWLGSGLVMVMGGATILFHDPRFVMFKPTVFFTYHGLVMLKPGWMYRYLPTATTAVPAEAARVRRRYVVAAGVVYATVTLGMAVLNTLLAMYASQKAWALFNAAGPAVVYGVLGSLGFLGGKLVLRKTRTLLVTGSTTIEASSNALNGG